LLKIESIEPEVESEEESEEDGLLKVSKPEKSSKAVMTQSLREKAKDKA
jgi:hypothetical protein